VIRTLCDQRHLEHRCDLVFGHWSPWFALPYTDITPYNSTGLNWTTELYVCIVPWRALQWVLTSVKYRGMDQPSQTPDRVSALSRIRVGIRLKPPISSLLGVDSCWFYTKRLLLSRAHLKQVGFRTLLYDKRCFGAYQVVGLCTKGVTRELARDVT